MAHTTISITTNEVVDDVKLAALKSAVYDAAAKHVSGIELGTEVVAPKLTLEIHQEQDNFNPRVEYDHVGVMFCKHGRYTLGDEDAENPYLSLVAVDLGGYKLYCEQSYGSDYNDPPDDTPHTYDSVMELLQEYLDEAETDEDAERTEGAIAWLRDLTEYDEHVLRSDVAVCLPIYLYDHSGLTVSHGSFSCRWDSGQVGWHYITKDAARENWGADVTDEQLTACLQAELKEYDCYLRGYVWGFTITNEEGDVVDSCWGYIGDELEDISFGIRDAVNEDEITDAEIEAAWKARYD